MWLAATQSSVQQPDALLNIIEKEITIRQQLKKARGLRHDVYR